MGRGVKIPWVGGSIYHRQGGQNTIGRRVDIPWVGGSKQKEALIAVSILHGIITVNTELEFYPWYFDPLTHGILITHTHGISIPHPWYFDPPTHGILTLYLWYIEPLTHGIPTPIYHGQGVRYTMGTRVKMPWVGGSIYQDSLNSRSVKIDM